MSTQTELLLAQRYLLNPHGYIQPLRRDELGYLIFDDGSWVDDSVIGEWVCGNSDPCDWIHREREAHELGRVHRLCKMKMYRAFRMTERRYPARVCRAYAEGFFSVPDWPKGDWS